MSSNFANRTKTRAGCVPDEPVLTFPNVTTRKMKEYMQKRFDIVIASINSKLPSGEPKMPTVGIELFTMKMGERFYPTLLVLPESVVYKSKKQKQKQKSNNPNEIDLSDLANDSGDQRDNVHLHSVIYELLKPFMYQKPKMFRDPEVRRYNGISNGTVDEIIECCTPRRNKMGNSYVVSILLDTYAILHAMLELEDDDRAYQVNLKHVKRLRDGEYNFVVVRRLIKKKGKHKDRDSVQSLFKALQNKAGFRSLN